MQSSSDDEKKTPLHSVAIYQITSIIELLLNEKFVSNFTNNNDPSQDVEM